MTTQTTFDDALDRMDFDFYDWDSMEEMIQALTTALEGRVPSDLQRDIAFARGQRHRAAAMERGLRVDRFFRRGQQVTQLRDARGRFIAQGASAISDLLDEDFDLFA